MMHYGLWISGSRGVVGANVMRVRCLDDILDLISGDVTSVNASLRMGILDVWDARLSHDDYERSGGEPGISLGIAMGRDDEMGRLVITFDSAEVTMNELLEDVTLRDILGNRVLQKAVMVTR
jgi:hypothetical protein